MIIAVLAIAAQICAGALPPSNPSATTPRAALNAAMVLCVGAHHTTKDGPAPVHRRIPELAIAAEFHHFAQHAAVLDNDSALPPPPPRLAFYTGVPEARGPPARFAAASYPTGPPTT